MDSDPQLFGTIPAALQQWIDAGTHLSKAIQAYVSATTFLESMCTPFPIKSLPQVFSLITRNLEAMEREELDLQRTLVALKKKRNSFVSPIYALPSELLATIFTAAMVSDCPYESYEFSEEFVKRSISRVCSRWRQVALDVCPVWDEVCLTLGTNGASEEKPVVAKIKLRGALDRNIHVPVDRQPGVSDAVYVQITLDTIAPYIKHLSLIDFASENVDQIQPFLSFWLEKGVPGSLTSLTLSVSKTALVSSGPNLLLSDRLTQYIRRIKALELFSVGLNWSSVEFNELGSLFLEDLPPACSPDLAQFARILSTCLRLRDVSLKRIQIPVSLDITVPEPVELRHLESLSLVEVDIHKLLSIITPPRHQIDLTLQGVTNDSDTFETLCSFVGRTNVRQLTLTLSKARLDLVLAQLLFSVIGSTSKVKSLTLDHMDLYESELSTLASYFLSRNTQIQSSSLINTTYGLTIMCVLELRSCIIYGTPVALHNVVSALRWQKLWLTACKYSPVVQGEGDALTETLEAVDDASDFGIRLKELIPDGMKISSW